MAEAVNNCPFCGLFFKSLGHHIYRCKFREGREYRQYLKTRGKTGADLLSQADQSGYANRSQQFQHRGLAESARPPLSSTPQLITVEPLSLPNPDDREAWEATNTFFSTHLVPHLMSLDDPDAINSKLTTGMYSYFSEAYGLQPSRNPKAVRRRKKHDRRVKRLRETKNAIRRKYREALRTQQPLEVIQGISKDFRAAMRDHARARKHSLNDDINRNAQAASRALKKSFWGYVNHLLGEDHVAAKATFTADQATTYFQGVFSKPSSKTFEAPEWLPTPKCPETPFVACSFTMKKIASRIKRGRLSSKLCPYDQVLYYILKRCPSLLPVLHHLYNKVWQTQSIPAFWRHAAIILIPKESALSDSSSPRKFRPIALTSCIGKIFTSMVKFR